MAGKPLKKPSLHGVTIRQLVDEIPAGCSTPDFEQKPVTMALPEGKNAILRAVVCGHPWPQVRWQCSKGELSNSSKYQISSSPGSKEHVLQINKLTGEDTDLYRCIAANLYGEATCSARLTVIEVGFRKKRKRQTEPQEDLKQELMGLRMTLRKRAPPPAPKKEVEKEQVWQLLMTADRKDYERLCIKYGIVDFRGMLRKLQAMRKEREDRMAQYVNDVSNLRQIKVTKEGVAFFEMDLDLKDPESKIYLYKDGEMVPYSSDSHTKRSMRRLGKHYHFQIQDLWPEDAGIYQVKVEDTDIFSTELEASDIPPRVLVPLAEAHCEERGDATFKCVLSNSCPNATWNFKQQALQPSGKYEMTVSPDGLTHQLVVRGVRLSDMGPYSLDTGLHASSAWLVVEEGKDKDLQITSADHQVQEQGALTSEAEESRSASGKGRGLREQGSMGGTLEGAGLGRGGLGGHGYSSMEDRGAADTAWGPGQNRKGFLEADGDRAGLPGENQLHREGAWDVSLLGSPYPQGEGTGSELGLTEGQQPGPGREHGGDSRGGPAGGWEAGSQHPVVGGLGGSGEGQEHGEDSGSWLDRHGQGPLWGAQLGPGSGGEGMGKLLQEDSLGELGGGDSLSRERGSRAPGAVWGSGGGLGESVDSNVAGGPGALGSPDGRGPSSGAGKGPETWGVHGRGDGDHGATRDFGGPGAFLGQTPAGKDFQDPLISGSRRVLGHGSPEGSWQKADDGGPGGPGGPGGWGRENQSTAGALGKAGDGRSLQYSQGGTAGQRGAGGADGAEAEGVGRLDSTGPSLGQAGALSGPGALGSGGGRGGMGSTSVPGLTGSGQEGDAHSPGQDAQGRWGTPGGMAGARGPGATGSEPDFWNGTWGSRQEPAGDTGYKAGLVGSRHGDGSGHVRGMGPEKGAGYGDGSGVPGEVGSARSAGALGRKGSAEGAGYRDGPQVPGVMGSGHPVGSGPGGWGREDQSTAGALGKAGDGRSLQYSQGGTAGQRGAGGADGMEAEGVGRSDSTGPSLSQVGAPSGPGIPAGLKDGSGGPDGGLTGEAGMHAETWDAFRGRGDAGTGGRHHSDGGLGSRGTVGSGESGGLGASATVGGGHVGAEPEGSGGKHLWGSTGDGGDVRASGAMGAFGQGGHRDGSRGPGSTEPGSLRAGGKVSDGDGTKGLGAGTPGAGIGSWDESRHPKVQAPGTRADSEGPQPCGSGSALGYGDGPGMPGPQQIGGRTVSGGGSKGLGPGGIGPGGEASHKGGIGEAGETGSIDKTGHQDGLRGPRGMGSGSEVGHRGGLGGSGEVRPEGETGYRDGSGLCGVTGSLDAEGHGSGHQVASEKSYGDSGSTGDSKKDGGPGLVDGASPRVGSRVPGAVGATAGQGFRTGPGGSATSGTPGSAGDRGAPVGEGGSANQAGGVGASGSRDSPGTVGGDAWAGTAALECGRGGDFQKAGRGGAAGQGAEDALLGGGREAGARGTGTGHVLDSGRMPGQRSKSTSGHAEGPVATNAEGPGWEDQGSEQGRGGAGNRSPRSRRGDASFRGTQGGPEGSRGRVGAAGQGEAGGGQGPGFLESKGSGPGRNRSAGPADLDGAWNGPEDPFGSRDYREISRGMGEPVFQLGREQKGERGSLGKQGSLEAENDRTRGSGARKESKGQGAAESGGSDRRLSPLGSRSQTQSGTKAGGAERRALDEARGRRERPGAEDTGSSEETLHEEGSSKTPSRLSRRRGSTEDKSNVDGQGKGASRSPRSRRKPGTGDFFEEARAPLGHFSRGLADTEAKLGETAVLSCTLSRDLGPGAWFKDGVELSAQDGLVFEQNGLVRKLLIAHVQGDQAGTYAFVAGDQKTEATLTVRDPPVIAPDVTETLREPLVVKAGKPVTVKIAFQSRLPVQATWSKGGVELNGGSSRGAQVALGDGFTRLCLPSARRKDSGQYHVTLKSKGGSVQAAVTLQVIDKPQPPQGPLEVQDCRGTGVCLHWRPPRDDGGRTVEHYVVERQQAGRSTWLKVGELPAGSTSFTDAQVERGKKYIFRVRAVTSEGPGEALESEEVLVAPEALPGPPSAPAILSAASSTITLTWTAPRGPGSAHLLGYLIDKRKKGSNTWTPVTEQPVPERRWTVTDLRPDCQYEFRVTAVAPSGPGEPGPSSDAVFARDPMRPPGPVRDLQVTDTSHTSIGLCWARPDAEDGDEVQGYVVELCASDSLEWTPCHVGTVPGTTYTAKGLRPQQGYFVRVTAVNDGGRSQPTVLDTLVHAMPVPVCPKFLLDSRTKDSLMVKLGDSIHVPVRFEAAPMPEVTWLKDGLPLTRRSVTSTKDGLTQLLVPVASLSDTGTYTVVLRSQKGEEATYTFFLRVAAKPQSPGPICLKENVPGTVTAEWEPSPDEARGVPLHYTVLTRSSSHGPWREAGDRIHTNRFTLLGVVPGHEYHFRVVAKNELGASEPSDTSQPWCILRQRDKFTVKAPSYREPKLNEKPWFRVGLRPHLLPTGCECCMSCAVRGWPRPRVTWFKNGESLEGSHAMYSMDTLGVCSLVIPSVTPQDSGLYKAVAENSLGQAISMATLTVTEPSF